MALQPCRECGQEVSREARACPHCGAADPTGAIAQAARNAAVQQAENMKRGCVGCLAIIVLLSVVIALGSFSSRRETMDNSPSSARSGALALRSDQREAWNTCREQAEEAGGRAWANYTESNELMPAGYRFVGRIEPGDGRAYTFECKAVPSPSGWRLVELRSIAPNFLGR